MKELLTLYSHKRFFYKNEVIHVYGQTNISSRDFDSSIIVDLFGLKVELKPTSFWTKKECKELRIYYLTNHKILLVLKLSNQKLRKELSLSDSLFVLIKLANPVDFLY